MFYDEQTKVLQDELDTVFHELNTNVRLTMQAKEHFESNCCTKYYFRLPGTKNDAIKHLQTSENTILTDTKEILEECKNYYQKMYTQPNVL